MEEQLKLIQELRLEVNRLISDRNEKKEKYDSVVTELDNTFYDIQDMNKKLEEATNILNLLVEGKTISLCLPLCIAVTAGMFIFINIKAGAYFPWIMYLVPSIAVGLLVFMSSYVITKGFYDKIAKLLSKKYPNIKKAYDNVNTLTNERNLKEQNLMTMKKDRDNLKITLKALEEQLDRKRDELDSVEEEYFDSLVGKTFTTEDGKHYTVGIVGRGKTKVRIPDISKNLGK